MQEITTIWVLPFITLLLLIAAGPTLFEHFWHTHGKKIAILFGLVVGGGLFAIGQNLILVETLADYFSFVIFLSALYLVAGGIYIFADQNATPLFNTLFLVFGAILANIIGTTGASVLLIRPYMRLNKYRLKPYLIVFFIFIVSNAGGMLTPLGDPPLFFGFLKGVPFFWNLEHLFIYWLVAVGALSTMFYVFDSRNKETEEKKEWHDTGRFRILGKRNFALLALLLCTLFLDPHIAKWIPSIHYHGHHFSFVRELIQLSIAAIAYFTANKKNNPYKLNHFSFEPINEVVFLFFGLFLTMAPALEVMRQAVKLPAVSENLKAGTLYWFTGTLSAFLDNAPTYIALLSASMSKYGLSLQNYDDLQAFLSTDPNLPCPEGNFYLIAISISAVLFGAGSYIGNGPNLMVRAIAVEEGVKMPGFIGYIGRYSIPLLLPVLLLVFIIMKLLVS